MYHGRHDHHAREERRVVQQLPGEPDKRGYVFRGGKALRGVDLPGLRGKQHLSRLHADIHALDAAEAQVAARPVQHDCAAAVDHVGLEEDFVDVAGVVDDIDF